jgi:hypothetical protein
MTKPRIIPIVLAALLAATGVAAEDRDAVFIHGLASDAGTWTGAAGRLSQQLAIRPLQASLNWGAFYEAQAAEIEQKVGVSIAGNAVAIGHSNGGVVARQWGRNRGLGAVVTLGSPNQGAPIVDHLYEWFAFLDDLIVRITNVNLIFTNRVNREAWWWVPLEWVVHHNLGMHARATAGFGLIALGFDARLPVLSEMRAGGGYMLNLNSADNRGREAAAVPARSAIVNVAAEFDKGGPMRLLQPDRYQDWHEAINAAAVSLETLAALVRIMADGRDVAAFDLADEISGVAEWFFQFEEVWCRAVSDPSPLPIARCREHDGIVPTWSQAWDYPRVPVIFRENGPVHTRETSESDAQLFQALTTVAQIAERTAPPASEPPPASTPSPQPVTPPDATPSPQPAAPPETTPPPQPIAPPGSMPGTPVDAPGGSTPPPTPPAPPPPPSPADPPPPIDTPPPAPPPTAPTPPPTGRYKLTGGGCVWDPNDSGPDQCSPAPPPGRFKLDGWGNCYWEPNDFPPDQCAPPPLVTGRYKLGPAGCYWDPNDGGPNQCTP